MLEPQLLYFSNMVFDAVVLLCGVGLYSMVTFLFHRLIFVVERTTLQHADDEIILDDNEIRLVKMDRTQISLP